MLPHTGTKSRSSSSLPDSEGGEGDNAKSVNIQGRSRVICHVSTFRVGHVSLFDVPFGVNDFGLIY